MSAGESPHPFDEFVQKPESEIRLAHAALLCACDEYQGLTPARYLQRLNALADRIDREDAFSAYDRVAALRQVLVEAELYRGNFEDFANPVNSYLNRVIDTRRGIPISLSAIWLDVAEQLGWPIVGVSLPGHFIIRYEGVGEEMLIDPFNGGRELTHDDCAHMLTTLFGDEFTLTDQHLVPAGTRAILARMLGNLYTTYVQSGDFARTTCVLKRITALRPKDAMVRAELGRMQVLTGDLRGAAATLHQALDLADSDDERSTVDHHTDELRARMHEQN
ncbi:MAG: transglutaminase family protein [Phycisphaerae bacterium]